MGPVKGDTSRVDIDVIWLETASLAAAVFWAAILLALFLLRENLYHRFLRRWNGAQSERRVALSLLAPSLLLLFCLGVWIWLWQLRESPDIQIALPAADSVKIGNTTTVIGGATLTIGGKNNGRLGIGTTGNGKSTNNKGTISKGNGSQKGTTGKGSFKFNNNVKGGAATQTAKPTRPSKPTVTKPAQTAVVDESCVSQGILSASQDCLDLVALVDKLTKAPIAYNRPARMYRGEPEQISLVIDPIGAADLKVEMRALTGPVIETETQITRNMSAEITGSLFEIEPAGTQTKTLSPLVPTRWDWRITPQKEGDAPLTLNIYVIFDQGEGQRESFAIRNYTDPVQVHVHAIDKVGDVVARAEPIYAFLVTVVTGLFGFCVWLIARWRRLKGGADTA